MAGFVAVDEPPTGGLVGRTSGPGGRSDHSACDSETE